MQITEGPLQSPQSPQSLSEDAIIPQTHSDQRPALQLPDPSVQLPGIALDHVPLGRAKRAYSEDGSVQNVNGQPRVSGIRKASAAIQAVLRARSDTDDTTNRRDDV